MPIHRLPPHNPPFCRCFSEVLLLPGTMRRHYSKFRNIFSQIFFTFCNKLRLSVVLFLFPPTLFLCVALPSCHLKWGSYRSHPPTSSFGPVLSGAAVDISLLHLPMCSFCREESSQSACSYPSSSAKRSATDGDNDSQTTKPLTMCHCIS